MFLILIALIGVTIRIMVLSNTVVAIVIVKMNTKKILLSKFEP